MLPGHTQHSFPHTLCKFCNECIFPSDGSYILSMVFQTLCDAACCVMLLRRVLLETRLCYCGLYWNFWTMQRNVHIEYCSQVSCLHPCSPLFCCYTLLISAIQLGPKGINILRWRSLIQPLPQCTDLHSVDSEWFQTFRKISSGGNQFLGVHIKTSEFTAMKCGVECVLKFKWLVDNSRIRKTA